MIQTRFLFLSLTLAFAPAFALPAAANGAFQAKESKGGQKEHPNGSCKCPVTGMTLAKGQGVLARAKSHTYRVADEAAAKALEANPDTYLQEDGTPKNQDK